MAPKLGTPVLQGGEHVSSVFQIGNKFFIFDEINGNILGEELDIWIAHYPGVSKREARRLFKAANPQCKIKREAGTISDEAQTFLFYTVLAVAGVLAIWNLDWFAELRANHWPVLASFAWVAFICVAAALRRD